MFRPELQRALRVHSLQQGPFEVLAFEVRMQDNIELRGLSKGMGVNPQGSVALSDRVRARDAGGLGLGALDGEGEFVESGGESEAMGALRDEAWLAGSY